MARMAVADEVQIVACTPHIQPGVYDNTGPGIKVEVAKLQAELDKAKIPLVLVTGADVHIAPDLVEGLKSGQVLPLGNSRYFLLEPPTGVVPPRFEAFVFNVLNSGYVPIITHPERLAWIESQYEMIARVVRSGVWTQLTAGSILGQFGRHARHWSLRLLEDGLVHIIASDAHNTGRRTPVLSPAFKAVEQQFGRGEAVHLVVTRPTGILRDEDPSILPMPARVGLNGHRAEI